MLSRQERLIEIIKTEKICRQSELVERLINEGYDVTQATISRDIKAIGIKKKTGDDKSYYIVEEIAEIPEHFLRVLKEGYLHAEIAMNILVIKTVSGLAMAVAAALDSCKFPELIGCIAGDDTIFVAASDINAAKKLKKEIEELL